MSERRSEREKKAKKHGASHAGRVSIFLACAVSG
jgi:hypothetical protein